MNGSPSVPRTPPAINARPHHLQNQLHRITPLLVLIVGVAALIGAYRLSLGELTAPGAGLWPFMVAAVITATAAILLVTDDAADYEPWTRSTVRILGGVLSLGAFILLFELIGFLIPAFLMLTLWLRVFGKEQWRWAAPLAGGGSIGMHLLFVEVFGVPFPDDAILFVMGS